MLIHYLLLFVATLLFSLSILGRRSGFAIALETIAFGLFVPSWAAGMSMLPERPAVGIFFPTLLALACGVLAVIVEMNLWAKNHELGAVGHDAERSAAQVEAGARLTVTAFFWLALFGVTALTFAPYVLLEP